MLEQFNEVEKAAIMWQYQLYGSFYMNLFKAIQSADATNTERLREVFPIEVEAFDKYAHESGWWQEVDKRYLSIIKK